MEPRFIVVSICVLALLVGLLYLIFKRKRLPEEDAPKSYHVTLRKRVRYYRELSPARQKVFVKRVQGFLEDVKIVGAGINVTEVDRLLVAASAEIPIFGFDQWRYANLDEVILHRQNFALDFDPEADETNVLGVVGDRELSRTMVLSKPALHDGFSRHTEENVGVHEFVHLLDMGDGAVDGTPSYYLEDGLVGPWLRLVANEIHKIKQGESELRPYGATNEAEFFAVASEYFFTKPEKLIEDHPELYGMLEQIFKQRPTDNNPVTSYLG